MSSSLIHRIENSLFNEKPRFRPMYAQESVHLKAAHHIGNYISKSHPKVFFSSLSYSCKQTNEIRIENYFGRSEISDQEVLELHLALTAHEAAHLRWTGQHGFVGWAKMIHNGLEDVRINALLKKTYPRASELLDLLYRTSQLESEGSHFDVPPAHKAIMCFVLLLQDYPYEWTMQQDTIAQEMFGLIKHLLLQMKHELRVRCDEAATIKYTKAIRRLWRPFLTSKKPPTSKKSKKDQANTSMFDFAGSAAHQEKQPFPASDIDIDIDFETMLAELSMEDDEPVPHDDIDLSTVLEKMESVLHEKQEKMSFDREEKAIVKKEKTTKTFVYRARKQDDVTTVIKTAPHTKKEKFLQSVAEQDRALQIIADHFEHSLGWQTRTRYGLLDSNRLVHTAFGENEVFRKRVQHEKRSTAFSVLIDASGSMYRGHPEKIDVALETAFVLCLLAQRLEIATEALAFTTTDFHAPHYDGYERSLPTKHMIIKGFDNHLTPEPFLHARDEGGFHNVDGEALEWAGERLSARTEQQKLLLVLSDGSPEADGEDEILQEHLLHTIRCLKARDVRVFGFGIQSDHVEKYYQPLCTTIKDINSFTNQGFIAFLRLLLEHQ